MTTTSSTIYVGNLPSQLDQSMLAAHFAPFGEIVALSLPSTGSRNKGFAFISFSSPDNALDALDNMNLNSIAGRTIHINLANPNKLNTTPNHNKPIWHSEDWLKQYATNDQQTPSSTEPSTETQDANPLASP